MAVTITRTEEKKTIFTRLGSAQESSPSGFWFGVFVCLTIIFGIFYANFKAMGLATGATGPIVKHGIGYTFLQPFYSIWAIYYVLIGSSS